MKLKVTMIGMLIVMLVTACGSANTPVAEPTTDVAAVRTSAASTVVSEFTLTAAAFTPIPSPLPLPTDTPVPQVTNTVTVAPAVQVTNAQGTTIALCDSLGFVADVNIPDGTTMSPGQDFVKTWKVKNTGSCPWGSGYQLVYADYTDKMSGQFLPLPGVVQPGEEVELSVQFKAPDKTGEYLSAWQMKNPSGVTFPKIIFVKIVVQ